MKQKVAVIGGGSWATAIVKILSENLDELGWWMRDGEVLAHIREHHHNPRYLSSLELPVERLRMSTDPREAIGDADILILVVPAAFLSDALQRVDPEMLRSRIVVSAIKGIVPEDNTIVGDFLHQRYGLPYERFAVICGPSHAEEVAMEKLSYLTIASREEDLADDVSGLLKSSSIKTVTSSDVLGTEYSAVLKNVISLATGICNGLGYGDNFQAVLIANALKEIERFLGEVEPMERDIKDSAYLGDLLVTAYSQFSRNRMFGNMIGRGYSVKAARLEMQMIAEGYYAVKCIHDLNQQYHVDMPITEAVHGILYAGGSPDDEMEVLSEKLY
jgi:glycerol-3-phosphate dehydrogenase (NAD(P)+)